MALFAVRAVWMISGCALELDPAPDDAWLVYDPVSGHIPSPNDLVRDAEAGHLALPLDDALPAAENGFRELLDQQDGWSSAAPITFSVTAPLDPASLVGGVTVYRWGAAPVAVDGLVPVVADDQVSVSVPPPVTGWERGETYVVVARGGPSGLRTVDGRPIGPDAVFVLLSAPETLLGHDRAVPGATLAERTASLEVLEATRVQLQPMLTEVERVGVPRSELAALFSFTVTRRPELAMDPVSQRVPVPFDLLIDPATGLVALPPAPDDDDLTIRAKSVLNTYNGFSLTGDLVFEVTAPVTAASLGDRVELWTTAGEQLGATTTLWNDAGPCPPDGSDCRYVVVDPEQVPLTPGQTYAVVVRDGVVGVDGEPLAPMGIGALLRLDDPVAVDGDSQVLAASDADAARVEGVRIRLDPLLDRIGRDGIVAAWPFTAMNPEAHLRSLMTVPESFGYDPQPVKIREDDLGEFFSDDALGWLFPPSANLLWPLYYYDDVRVPDIPASYGTRVIEGAIPSPYFLDPTTRAWVEPGELQQVKFVATVPTQVSPNEPIPVVIFTHGVLADRRWVVTVASQFSKHGMATVSIDLPYHGDRAYCVNGSLAALPNFLPPVLRPDAQDLVGPAYDLMSDLISLHPCKSGAYATCSPTGQCLDPSGVPEGFASFPPDPPIVDVRPASGAAMLNMADLPYVPAHLDQALVDLAALRYSLQNGDWESVLGQKIGTSQFGYAGHSLGSILGAVYAAVDPTISRAVLNVPAANVVEVFVHSQQFSPQLETFVASLEVEEGSWEYHELLNASHWLADAVDPVAVAHVWRAEDDRLTGLIQIDRVDPTSGDMVIPNFTSDLLVEVTGLESRDYPSTLHVDLLMPTDVGDAMVVDMANFIAGVP